MTAANPYFIYIDLFLSDGVTRPTQNQIARVEAYDVNGTTVTDEGQSGFNPATGGWMPVYMQNIAAFSPPRDQPNLKFQVYDTTNALVYTTQVFNTIASGSTVKIVIGVSASIEGTGSFTVTGHVRNAAGAPVNSGTVTATDVTNGSTVTLGLVALASDGSYSISFLPTQFANNGSPHVLPNLQITAQDGAGQLLAQSPIVIGAANNAVIDLTVAAPPTTEANTVFGSITNSLGLPVAGVYVQAYDVVWTTSGIQELSLAAAVQTDGNGHYLITYASPVVPGSPTSCGPPTNQINLQVKAFTQDTASPPNQTQLALSPILVAAASNQEVDLTVTSVAVSTTSEYTQLNNALSSCLGSTDAIRFTTLNLLNTRSDFLAFVAQTINQPQPLILAYVRAWLVAGEINAKVGTPPLVRAMAPEVIYGLIRSGLGTSLTALITVMPDQFFDAIVTTIHEGIISASFEAELRSSPGLHDSLLDDWKTVLATMMTRTPQQGEVVPFQQPLLALVLPSTPITPAVSSVTPVSFPGPQTSDTIVLPTGIAAGDLLLIFFTNDGSGTVTAPTGWTQLWSTATTSSTPIRFSGYAKIGVAADSGASITFTTSASVAAVAQVYRISQPTWSGISTQFADGVSSATPVTGSSTSLDPPALTPAWGAAGDLWIACVGHDLAISQTGGAPTSYTGNTRTTSNSNPTSNSVTMLSAVRVNNVATENPGPFTIATADDWVAQTVAIKPGLSKAQLVAKANFDNQGSFDDLVAALVKSGALTAADAENLTFVFDMYHKVGGFFPIVAVVYGDKVNHPSWHTTADLGTVPLNGNTTTGVKGWVDYAGLAASSNNGAFPGDVPGRSFPEKAGV
ncbi:MAG TPA: carboxypeptidase-like regulatory domain-containing protein, partial [Polyangia bacterium]|nr:carboxypeptidase-like regulatory domain-containing protein [Polyangia bacterium]